MTLKELKDSIEKNAVLQLIQRVEGLSKTLFDIKDFDPSAARRDEMVDEALAKYGPEVPLK